MPGMNEVLVRGPRWAWGMLVPAFGYGRCFRCRRPWWLVHGRTVRIYEPTTRYAPPLKQFVLCQGCWRRASEDERVAAHRWQAITYPESTVLSEQRAPLDDIEDAVRRDSAEELGWLRE